MSELAELAEEAVKKYLTGLVDGNGNSVWPDSMRRGAAEQFALRIFAGETDEDKDGQNIFAAAEKEFPEHIPSSGIYEVPIKVVLRTPTQKLTDGEKGNSVPEPLANHSAAAEQLKKAMMVNGLELLLSTAYVPNQSNGFTVFGVLDRQPGREQSDPFWESSFSCRLVCAPKSFPN